MSPSVEHTNTVMLGTAMHGPGVGLYLDGKV
jgi:hypothetical protein